MDIKNVAVLGGGISGLSLGYYLSQLCPQIHGTVIEKGSTVGGWMQSYTKENFFFEKGPRTFRTKNSEELLELVHLLGLQDRLIESNPQASRRYILAEGVLRQVGLNPFCYVMRKCLPEILSEWKKSKGSPEDESVATFVSRRFGPHVTELLFDPLITGVYAGNIDKVSICSAFPILKKWEQENGSVTQGYVKSLFEWKKRMKGIFHAPLFSFKEGTKELVEALEKATPMRIVKDLKVEDLEFTADGVVVTTPFEALKVGHVFSTLPPHEIGRLLRPYHEEIATLLLSIPMASLIIVNVGYKKCVLRHHGFGYLVPRRENESVLGVVFDSEIFPEHNNDEEETRLTVMMKISEESHEKIMSRCLEALERHLEITSSPDFFEITKAKHCIPQFEVGHEKKIARIKELIAANFPRLSLGGNIERGVSINGCIKQSKHLAYTFANGIS